MPADTSYANRFKRLSGLTISNFRLSQPNASINGTADNTYVPVSNVRTAAPINIVNSAVQDFNDPRLFTASVGQSVVTVQCSDPSGTIYTIFNVNPGVPGGLGFTKSIDNGLTWSAPVYVDGPTYTVSKYPAMVAKYGSKLVGIGYAGGAFTYYNSSDCGQTWTVSTPFIDNLGNTVGRSHLGNIGNISFRDVTNNSIARTTDGLTWTNISLPFTITNSSKIRSVGGTKFIGTGYTGTQGSSLTMTPAISISTDSGLTWGAAINLPGTDYTKRVADIAISGTTLFALIFTTVGSNGGTRTLSVSKSTDGGSSWDTPYTIISSLGLGNFGNTMLVSGSNIIIAYFDSLAGYIIRSTDNGVSWLAPVNLGAADDVVGTMVVKSGANLVVSIKNGVSVSTNNGVSWSFVSIPNLIAGDFNNGALYV